MDFISLSNLLVDFSLYIYEVIVFSCVIGYVSQYALIQKNNSIGSFSPKVCGILLLANILRIFFWFGKPFETALLLQSFVMVVTQVNLLIKLLLLSLCIRIKTQNQKQIKKFSPLKLSENFWEWDDFLSYCVLL